MLNEAVAVTSRSFSKHPKLREALTARYEKVTFNDAGVQLEKEALIKFLKGHDKVILGLDKLNESVLKSLPELKVVSRFGVGVDTLDLKAMSKFGIALSTTAGANRRAVAELVIAFSIMTLRHLPLVHQELLEGKWRQLKGCQLSDRCFGIIGFGSVGQDLACLLNAFGSQVLVYDVIDHKSLSSKLLFKQVSLDELLQTSDVISLHIPFNENTRNLLNRARLAHLKSNAILINTARGELVDEVALFDLLSSGKIAGAAFDVFSSEPPENDQLLHLPNFFCTPHIGGSTEEAIFSVGMRAIKGLETAEIF